MQSVSLYILSWCNAVKKTKCWHKTISETLRVELQRSQKSPSNNRALKVCLFLHYDICNQVLSTTRALKCYFTLAYNIVISNSVITNTKPWSKQENRANLKLFHFSYNYVRHPQLSNKLHQGIKGSLETTSRSQNCKSSFVKYYKTSTNKWRKVTIKKLKQT